MTYETKDSGEREQFDSGMQRDTQAGKLRYDLAIDGPVAQIWLLGIATDLGREEVTRSFLAWYNQGGVEAANAVIEDIESEEDLMNLEEHLFERYAGLMTRGAEKYSARNWMKATGEAELERARASASRHFYQWLTGEDDEDHAAAVVFNMNLAEYVRGLPTETLELAGGATITYSVNDGAIQGNTDWPAYISPFDPARGTGTTATVQFKGEPEDRYQARVRRMEEGD